MEIRAPRSRPGARGAGGDHAHPGQRLRARGRLLPHRGRAALRRRPRLGRLLPRRGGGAGVQRRHREGAPSGRPARPRTASFVANASCGLCGKTTLDEIEQQCPPVADGPSVARSVLAALPDAAARRADGVRRHRRPARGRPVHRRRRAARVREDVGRHNALDKVDRARAARAGSCRSPTTCSWCRAG